MQRSRHIGLAFYLSGFLLAALASDAAGAEEVNIQRFEATTVCGDLVQPMELAIAPDGKIFLIELGGTIKRIDPGTGLAEVVGKLEVTTAQENGLIGLALDPNFAENQWLYLQYSPPDFSGQYVSRFTFRDGQVDSASERRLFSYEEQRRECCHHAGSLEFGPDGNLYIGTGDNTNPFKDSRGYAPIDERPNREPWDAQRSSANTKSYNGKVLRIHPEADGTYTIPDGNLFPKDGSVGHPEIYVMGCRNPWRINVDQRTGYLYWGDVGPDAGADHERGPRGYDEVNQARTAGNFGWPYFIGNNFAYSMVDFATGKIGPRQDPAHPLNRSVNNTGAEQLPPAQPAMIYYPAAASPEFPEMGSGGRTACAGPVYYYDPKTIGENGFPAAYDRTLFAYEWSRSTITAVHLDADSKVQRLEPFLPQLKFTRPIDLQFDAGGSLYVIVYGETWGVNPDARLVRIDYVRGNRTPQAVAKITNNVGREPLTVQLSAADSTDKDGDKLAYRWTAVRNAEGQTKSRDLANTADATAVFEEPGVYTVKLQVTDPSGASHATSMPVIVGNAQPQVEFLKPADGDFYSSDAPIRYSLVVRDSEDGTSDFDQAEEDGWHAIEATAPSRLFTQAIPVVDAAAAADDEDPGLALIRKSDCFNCHAVHRPLVGPSFEAIATKYRDQPHQLEQSVKRVMEGSTGVWGKVGMLPHQQHSVAEVQKMVEYVFAVEPGAGHPTAQGFNNKLAVSGDADVVRLEATYTDLGRGEIPKLSGVATVTLRRRKLQAEAADAFQGTRPLNSAAAEGKKFMGAIEHNGFLKFENMPLDQITGISVRVASAGAGGDIEIRRGAVDGPVLGRTTVEVNGQWEVFHDQPIEFTADTGRDTLFVVFKNEQRRGGLMNIDSIRFE